MRRHTDDHDSTRRLFFALWPDEEVRKRLTALLRALPDGPGRNMRATNLHVTLCFLGNCPQERLPCIQAAGGSVRGAGFELVLDTLGVFEQARVLWAGATRPPQALFRLQDRLANALETRCGLRPDERPYRPHLTLRRGIGMMSAPAWPEGMEPIYWQVNALTLVQSVPMPTGVEYRPLHQWPLQGKR